MLIDLINFNILVPLHMCYFLFLIFTNVLPFDFINFLQIFQFLILVSNDVTLLIISLFIDLVFWMMWHMMTLEDQ